MWRCSSLLRWRSLATSVGGDVLIHEIAEGECGWVGGLFYIRPPGARRAALAKASTHQVIANEDGTITVLPSIVYSTPDRPDYFHGWLTNGVWRDSDGRVITASVGAL